MAQNRKTTILSVYFHMTVRAWLLSFEYLWSGFANRTRKMEKLVDHQLPLLSVTDQGQCVSAQHANVAKSVRQNLDLGCISPKGFNIDRNGRLFNWQLQFPRADATSQVTSSGQGCAAASCLRCQHPSITSLTGLSFAGTSKKKVF